MNRVLKILPVAAVLVATNVHADFCNSSSLLVMGPSWHSKATIIEHEVHNDTFGLGFGCEVGSDWTIYAGSYRNSFHDLSVFSTGVWSGGIFRDVAQATGVELGLGAGLVFGYNEKVMPIQVGGVAPMGFLSVHLLRADAVDVGALVIPPGEKDGSWVVNFHVKVGL